MARNHRDLSQRVNSEFTGIIFVVEKSSISILTKDILKVSFFLPFHIIRAQDGPEE